jgi:hypothetical protein
LRLLRAIPASLSTRPPYYLVILKPLSFIDVFPHGGIALPSTLFLDRLEIDSFPRGNGTESVAETMAA